MSAKTTDMGPPIGQPSIRLINQLLTKKVHSFVDFINNFLKIDFLLIGSITFLVYILYMM